MSAEFSNKGVVVTGAAKGVGAAIAEAFRREGARVALVDVDVDAGSELTRRLGPHASFLQADVSNAAQVERAFHEADKALGGFHILINNADIQTYGTVTETSEDVWDRTLNANLKSAFLCSRSALSVIQREGGGVVINMASVQSFLSQHNVAAYTTSKTAMLGLTRSIAIDYAPSVRCVAVCPGTVDTPMLDWAIRQSPNPDEVLEECKQMHPLGRIASPHEIAELVLFSLLEQGGIHHRTVLPNRWRAGRQHRREQTRMKITNIKATTITVPLEAPLRHANGSPKLYKELGGYAYDRDPARPGWYAILPEQRHATLRSA